MRRLAVFAALCVAAACVAGCGDSTKPPLTHQVAITGSGAQAFAPDPLTVRVGDAVEWTNADTTAHQVVSDDGGILFGSAILQPDSSYSFTFTAEGTVAYTCGLHAASTGTIIVEAR